MVPSDSKSVFDAELGAELAQILTVWPTLPTTMRQGIIAMIQASQKQLRSGEPDDTNGS